MRNYLLPATSIVLLALILIGIPGKDSFRFTASDTMGRINVHEHIITSDKLKELDNQDGGLLLVDLRSGQEFLAGHLPGAVNIPSGELNVGLIHNEFKGSRPSVLYSAGSPAAAQLWILLTQMGFENIYVLDTGNAVVPSDEISSFEFIPDTMRNN